MKTINCSFAKRAFVILSTLFLFVIASAREHEGLMYDDSNIQTNEAVNNTDLQINVLPSERIHPVHPKQLPNSDKIIQHFRQKRMRLNRANHSNQQSNSISPDAAQSSSNGNERIGKDPLPKPNNPGTRSDPKLPNGVIVISQDKKGI